MSAEATKPAPRCLGPEKGRAGSVCNTELTCCTETPSSPPAALESFLAACSNRKRRRSHCRLRAGFGGERGGMLTPSSIAGLKEKMKCLKSRWCVVAVCVFRVVPRMSLGRRFSGWWWGTVTGYDRIPEWPPRTWSL